MNRVFMTALVAFLIYGCAMIRGGNPVTTPDPHKYPCGLGVECADTNPKTCCGKGGECRSDSDGPYCQYTTPDDPADPTMLRKRTRGPRQEMSK
jgi:hypothetical protein